MPFAFLTNTALDEAIQKYQDVLIGHGLRYRTEIIDTQNTLNRVSAHAVYARISAPHYNACGMDGIALDSKKTFGATETTPVKLGASDFLWVDTGDPLPVGCDAVVMVEDVVEADGWYLLYSAAVPWQNVRQIGEDISAGDMIIPSFTVITPASMAPMLAAGVLQVEVVKRPVIGILPTGDEMVLPTEKPREGDIIEFNSSIFSGMLTEWGCIPKVYPIVKDDLVLIQEALAVAIGECDGVIINAGSSAGRADYAKEAIQKVGEVVLHGIAIKPGKPAVLAFAMREGLPCCVPVVGVPGYPVSGIIVMDAIFKPLLEKLTYRTFGKAETIEAVVSRRLTSSLKYREFIRARLGWWVDGWWQSH